MESSLLVVGRRIRSLGIGCWLGSFFFLVAREMDCGSVGLVTN